MESPDPPRESVGGSTDSVDSMGYPMGEIEATDEGRAEAANVVESVVQYRRDKANRSTRGVLSALLMLEALVVLLVPRAIAQTSTGLSGTKATLLITLAVLLLLTAFVLKRPWGIGVGSVLQIGVLVTAVLTLAMLVVGLIFLAIWIWVLTMRRDLAGTPGGWKILVS